MIQSIMRNNKAQKQYIRKGNLIYLKRSRDKKKKGFTLIELIAVIAIIGMMASILLPKFTNYMSEAKKLKVVEQSRKVVMAVESYNMKANSPIKETEKVSDAKGNSKVTKYFEDVDKETDKLSDNMSIQDCYRIVSGEEFSINPETGVFTNLEGGASGDIPQSKQP